MYTNQWDVCGLFRGFTLERLNDKHYNIIGMLKKVNYAICWFLTSCDFIQYVASFINRSLSQYL